MKDVTSMLEWTARETYDPVIASYVVPEGVQVDPTGTYVFRTGDQGNGVQEAEIVKMCRILVGVDDDEPQRLRVMPRMPYGWTEIAVAKYPALVERDGRIETAQLRYDLRRVNGHLSMEISADRPLGSVAMRLGPFEKQAQISDVLVNGKHPAEEKVEQSGDSWWVSFTAPVGSVAATANK